ncbi:tRNA (guanosine(37)-N1)-methyltransferase TrmD [Propionibacteriaceae bacterium G57]|uniref:tRNA (guanosine(37)-N1)-methyltransferase TrmD n=1 Tax=Aestuariimicrobium sp. G57 TaxID=3418485 RepID=UPI003DA72F93
MRIDVVSIFPDYFAPLQLSLVGKAISAGLLHVAVHDLRHWTHDRHHTVDDTPYGGGAGMVMKPEPWGEALDALLSSDDNPDDNRGDGGRDDTALDDTVLVVPTPSGHRFSQPIAQDLSQKSRLIFACGRYEGIDRRVIEHARTRVQVRELSLGDYVLNGGEVATLAMVEAIVRLIPGVIGNPESLSEESHSEGNEGLLEYPVYTKPPLWRGLEVPPVLFSGHHAQIASWRRQQALELTRRRRPDLLPRQD